MNRIKHFSLSQGILWFAFYLVAFSQPKDPKQYFPHTVGDKWQWVNYYDASSHWVDIITHDSTGTDSSKYLFYNGEAIPSFKLDTLNQVFQFLNPMDSLGHVTLGNEILLYKLNAQASDSFYTMNNSFIVKVTTYNSSVFGQSTNVKVFTWYATLGGSEFTRSSLAWGFGEISTDGPTASLTVYVSGCNISGVNYGSLVSVSSEIDGIPNRYKLYQNYPNPFNPTTVISYQLSVASTIKLKVYDILGHEVATLVDGVKESGYYSVQFDGCRLSSGIYFARFVATPQHGNKPFIKTMKMLLMK